MSRGGHEAIPLTAAPMQDGDDPRRQGRDGAVARTRLDQHLIDIGLASGRGEARRLIEDGRVTVGGRVASRPGSAVGDDAEIVVARPEIRFASRGGLKLDAALAQFPLDVAGVVALDTGASTGGFTDVLLRHGAARVYAIDVGYGQLAWSLRTDSRVVVMERTNIRYVTELPESPAIATIDVSFISLDLVLPAVSRLLTPDAQAICLIKPQFEVGRHSVGKGGVVRSVEAQSAAVNRIMTNALAGGWLVGGLIESPVLGPAGNREFLTWLHHDVSLGCIDLNRETQRVVRGSTLASDQQV
jgi:23S rRNA (cytidine1920-2'-O)/16S rRNA (cytidine1409-2'-O)-methyltransferase